PRGVVGGRPGGGAGPARPGPGVPRPGRPGAGARLPGAPADDAARAGGAAAGGLRRGPVRPLQVLPGPGPGRAGPRLPGGGPGAVVRADGEKSMYHRAATPRDARRRPEGLPGLDPAALARQALGRVRKLLTAYLPGMSAGPARLLAALGEAPLAAPGHEAERLFARGWLRWLEGDFAGAEALLAEALERARGLEPGEGSPDLPPL